MPKVKRPLGFIFYNGPSEIDAAPIVAIATLKSSNTKTGDVVQTWILAENMSPMAAINTGDDSTICGACPMRGELVDNGRGGTTNIGRGCYVDVSKAPRGIWQAYKNGRYPIYDSAAHDRYINGRIVRMGSYGEPPAVPMPNWQPILDAARGRLGYTHLWQIPKFQFWAKYVMASIHSEKQAARAKSMGWRYFRTRLSTAPLIAGEFVCPASAENDKMDCNRCGACDGNSLYQLGSPMAPLKISPVIMGHGAPARMRAVDKVNGK